MNYIQRAENGYRIGESHHRARHSDDTVEAARQMHDDGMRPNEIAKALEVSYFTVYGWLSYRTR